MAGYDRGEEAGNYRSMVPEPIESRCTLVIERWTPIIGVTVHGFYIQQMRTKWGSCNHLAGTIRLNTELAKKPKECSNM